jgi:hypothetical protein
MDAFALLSFLIMGTATLCGLSLLGCLVALERDPDRWRPVAPTAKPYRRHTGSLGRQAPTARRPVAHGRSARKAVVPTSRKRQTPKRGSSQAC